MNLHVYTLYYISLCTLVLKLASNSLVVFYITALFGIRFGSEIIKENSENAFLLNWSRKRRIRPMSERHDNKVWVTI